MMSTRTSLVLSSVLFATIAIVGSGCSSLMGALRPDLDDTQAAAADTPTTGGRWAERGFLDESVPERGDRYDTVGHSERAPASMDQRGGDEGWSNSDRDYQNQRDQARDDGGNAVSYSNTPNLAPQTKRLYKNGNRATRADFIDESPNEGSLWGSDGQTNYYFTKNKVRGVGDIVTLNLEDGLIKDMGLEVRRTLNDRERTAELGLAKDRARSRIAGADKHAAGDDAVAGSQAAPARAPTDDKKKDETEPEITPGDVDVSKSLELKVGDTVMCEIVERYPNGNYKIRGSKRVNYRNGAPRMMNVMAIVRGADIGEDDTVASGKLYEYKLEAVR